MENSAGRNRNIELRWAEQWPTDRRPGPAGARRASDDALSVAASAAAD